MTTDLYFNEAGPAIFEICFSETIISTSYWPCQICMKISKALVIVTDIWQKLSSVEHKQMLIVKNNWQLFSQIIGGTQHAPEFLQSPTLACRGTW